MRKNRRWFGKKIRCGTCNAIKDTSKFHRNKSRGDGFAGQCKSCCKSLYPPRKMTGKGQKKSKRGTIQKYNRTTTQYAVDPKTYEIERLFSWYKTYSAKAGRDFSISLEYYESIITLPCDYCGGFNDDTHSLNGIDRVDNSIGYVEGNCAPCCKTCNFMKHAHNRDFFISHVLKITKKLRS